jgi:P4 family phage/plasmid primase-like protien
MYKLSPLDAAKRVCDAFSIAYEQQSDEDKAAFAAAQEKRIKELQAQKEKAARELEAAREKKQPKLLKEAGRLKENFYNMYPAIEERVKKIFPRFSQIGDFAHLYLGWDAEHDSIAIVNQYKGKIYNIKHREKFLYKNGNVSDKRMNGKWIGQDDMSAFPFPLEYFNTHEDNRIVLCEGEKDALNLLSVGVNCLTLGGCGNKWIERKELLRDKIVYIWFDNDMGGYTNAVKRYREIEEINKNIYIVLFYTFKESFPNKYDISDYLATHPLESAESVFEALTYNSFRLTNDIISDIEEIYNINLLEYKTPIQIINFKDITKKLLEKAKDKDGREFFLYVVRAKGEADSAALDNMLSDISRLKQIAKWGKFIDIVEDELNKIVSLSKDEKKKYEGVLERALEFKRAMLTAYRQTHIADCAEAFMQMMNRAGYSMGEYNQSLYFWTGSHYYKTNEISLTKFIHTDWISAAEIDVKKKTKNFADDITANVKSLSTDLNEIRRYEDRTVINCLNGTIFISKRGKVTFTPKHDKKNAALNILPFEYDTNATAPKWEKFLNRVLSEKEERMALMEFIGYCFLPSHMFETFLFLYGKSGANGKSVILDVIRNFFGSDNVSALNLQQLEGHQLDALAGKLINIGSEIDRTGTDKGQFSVLKSLVSKNDILTINPKNKDAYTLLPVDKPKMVFSGNDKPKGGLDNGVFRRMLLINFSEEIKDDEKIRDLSERFSDEMSGIFNLALEGLARLIRRGAFSRSQKMLEELEAYKEEVNPLRVFIKEAIVPNKYHLVPCEYVYRLYVSWAKNRGSTPMTNKTFGRAFKEEMNVLGIPFDSKPYRFQKPLVGISNLTPRCYDNIGISVNFEIESITMSDKDETIINTRDMTVQKGLLE